MVDKKERYNKLKIMISSILSNSTEFFTEREFSRFIREKFTEEEFPELTNETCIKIYNDFLKINPLERESVSFDFDSFIENYISV